MKSSIWKISTAVLVITLFWAVSWSRLASASMKDVNEQSLREVARIARAISVVQPYLDDGKYLEYALGIYRSSKRYGIEPAVLIAIAQQETGFRNDLPEGKAGELGIVQIRKMWVKQPKFRAEFPHARQRDLLKPTKSFLYAGWILKGLKDNNQGRTLPYWSFYNAVRFEPRLKYFVAVNQYISMLRKHENFFSERAVAANPALPQRVAPAHIEPARAWSPEMQQASMGKAVARAMAAAASSQPSGERTRSFQRHLPQSAPAKSRSTHPASVAADSQKQVVAKSDGNPHWIPDAFRKLQQDEPAGSPLVNADSAGTNHRIFSMDIVRAAAELDIVNSLQD